MAQQAQQTAEEEKRKEETVKDAAAFAVNKDHGSWAPPKTKEKAEATKKCGVVSLESLDVDQVVALLAQWNLHNELATE